MPELYDAVAKKTYPLDGIDEIYIGRAAPGGHLRTFLGLEAVSKRHARVFRKEGQFWVEDLGSKNGTWLDEIKLEAPLSLKYGSRIDLAKIGYYPIIYREKGPQEGKPGPEMKDSALLDLKEKPEDDIDLKDEIDALSDKEFFERFG